MNSGKRESYGCISRYPASKDFFACRKTTSKSAVRLHNCDGDAAAPRPRKSWSIYSQWDPFPPPRRTANSVPGVVFCFSFHFVFVIFFCILFHVPTIVRKGNGRVTRWRPSGIDHSPDVPGVRIKTDMCFRDEDYGGKNKRNDDH